MPGRNVPKFITKKWVEVYDQPGSAEDRYKLSKQIRFKTSMLRQGHRERWRGHGGGGGASPPPSSEPEVFFLVKLERVKSLRVNNMGDFSLFADIRDKK